MSDDHAVASAIIRLMQGVIYRESDEDSWLTLERSGAGVRDHFATIGVDVVIDTDEGYAYLRSRPEVESLIPPTTEAVDPDLLFTQTFVDQARLIDNIRSVLPERSAALLSDIVEMYPLEHGAAEIVSYLALDDGDVAVEMDESDETILDYDDPSDPAIVRRARLPKVTVRRR